ncbi:hypothetical protein ACFQDD_00670 [Halorubrum pallidum]|uniref:Uncharacterized protein n=1 Tax=Halorubrum pallidum TaxID=1526114 RepID=A0ABD5SYL7_9EURY
MDLDDLDSQSGFVDYPAENGGWNRVKYDSILKARLAFGLWQRVGPYDDPSGDDSDSKLVPLRVAAATKADLVAYLLVTKSGRYTKRTIANLLDVTTATVRNHATRVRTKWSAIATLPDRAMFTCDGSPLHHYADLYTPTDQ